MNFRTGLSALCLCACATAAYASVAKVSNFMCVNTTLAGGCPEADGAATFKFDERRGATRIHLVLHDLAPNTTYSLEVSSDGGYYREIDVFTSDSEGHAVFEDFTVVGSFPQNIGDDAQVRIFVSHEADGEPGSEDIAPDEDRVIGIGR
jgi:hypothetical protein